MSKVVRIGVILGFIIIGLVSAKDLVSQDSSLQIETKVNPLELLPYSSQEEKIEAILFNIVILISGGEYYLDDGIYTLQGNTLTYYKDEMVVSIHVPEKNGMVEVNVIYKHKKASTEFALIEY